MPAYPLRNPFRLAGKKGRAGFFCLLCLSTLAHAAAWQMDFGRLGPIRVGMTDAEVRKVGGKLKDDTVNSEGDCHYVDGHGFTLQFEAGELREINVGSLPYRMANGIGVGSTFAAVERVYGKPGTEEDGDRVWLGSNYYEENVPQITVEATRAVQHRFHTKLVSIRFEFEQGPLTRHSRITSISIGTHPAEGCI